ncbi:phosphoribosylformylglycinamidine synthase subunit PurQ [Desulfohalovibrio reitneri]|uniref:phosphoribosylformylglycinamidine synthase subunit PurQ n=1 Tax=Desulfohalovibrio reitneri TaxID=1307759 RepID=UPI0004A733C3|nr:phosphoribosylformylglycinamidine synthase subunit PurQ [Desulfohalovibrio reitneri]
MARVSSLVITGYGTNCDRETAHAARLAGCNETEVVFFSDLLAERVALPEADLLLFPGGFLDGDDLGAAQAAALRWRHAVTRSGSPLLEQLRAFLERGGLILGICNGFQLLCKLGLLPAVDGDWFKRTASLSANDSARFEDRWVSLRTEPDTRCVFLKGTDRLEMPVRHGEGKMVFEDESLLSKAEAAGHVALRYVHPESGEPSMEYPYNPNGSPGGIAGLTDHTGRILGLMPHPEAFNHPTNHPGWTRGETSPLGIVLLENAVHHLRERAA